MASMKNLVIFCIILLINKNASSITLPKFRSILIFGDSLVDTGNNNFIDTAVKANHRPYGVSFPNRVPTGRFSNGLLMSDLLASALGVKDLVPPFLDPNLPSEELKTGVCFASAGSGYDDRTNAAANIIPVSKQVDYLRKYIGKLRSVVGEEEANETISDALVFVVAGSNDYIANYYMSPGKYTPTAFQDFLHQRLQDFTKGLYDLGCRNFLIAGIPPLPEAMSYNEKLKTLLPKMQATLLGSKIVYADIAKPLTQVTSNPSKYGILVLDMPCCQDGVCSTFSPVCPNPDQYFRWDSIHPTQATYKVMSQSLLEESLQKFSK